MRRRRLSFVIPAHNEEALIGEVLEAILASVARASSIVLPVALTTLAMAASSIGVPST